MVRIFFPTVEQDEATPKVPKPAKHNRLAIYGLVILLIGFIVAAAWYAQASKIINLRLY